MAVGQVPKRPHSVLSKPRKGLEGLSMVDEEIGINARDETIDLVRGEERTAKFRTADIGDRRLGHDACCVVSCELERDMWESEVS